MQAGVAGDVLWLARSPDGELGAATENVGPLSKSQAPATRSGLRSIYATQPLHADRDETSTSEGAKKPAHSCPLAPQRSWAYFKREGPKQTGAVVGLALAPNTAPAPYILSLCAQPPSSSPPQLQPCTSFCDTRPLQYNTTITRNSSDLFTVTHRQPRNIITPPNPPPQCLSSPSSGSM
jgi:hypothetical protein